MAYLLPDSQPAMQLENQLFAVPASYTDRWRTEHERIGPTAVLTEEGTSGDINFVIPPSSAGLLSLADVFLEVEVAIKKKSLLDTDWQFIDQTDKVAPVNNFIHSLFQSVHVTVGNRMISDASTYYPFRAYFETLLRYSEDAMNTQLTASGFSLDTPHRFNDEVTNEGEKIRADWFHQKEYVQLSGKIFADFFQQSKPLITGVPMGIRLVIARQQFMLRNWLNPTDPQIYRVFIRNPRIYVRRYIPAPDFMVAVADQLQTRTVKYHMERTVMRVFDVSANTHSTVFSNVQIGQLPKAVFVAFLHSEDFHGSGRSSPYNFQHCNITQISVEVDGQSFPTKPYTADFEKKRALECYDGLLDTLGRKGNPEGEWCVGRNGYLGGYTLFGFDLTPGNTGLGPLTLIKQGNLSVSVIFGKPLAKATMMVCMLVYDSILEINQHRQVIADFTT